MRSSQLRRCRGVVLVEFTMIIGLLATILGLTFFFGWALTNQQHLRVASRYQSWARVRTGSFAVEEEVNRQFLAGRANVDTMEIEGFSGYGDAFEAYCGETTSDEIPIGKVADEGGADRNVFLIVEEADYSPLCWNNGMEISAEFPSDVGLYKRFSGAMVQRHIRDGVEWRRHEMGYMEALRDIFFQDMDDEFSRMGDLGNVFSFLYTVEW